MVGGTFSDNVLTSVKLVRPRISVTCDKYLILTYSTSFSHLSLMLKKKYFKLQIQIFVLLSSLFFVLFLWAQDRVNSKNNYYSFLKKEFKLLNVCFVV